ncbi:MAG TPA: shikimate dehydrogenase [Anaerohalosphaeraceae bacterium]|nr:shikimate dehydrogenase [Anaerohalosphaeraceae bacterium]HPB93904.1 shikimate dehydrogenase [Anaerohalosphaeraceae bacterium]HRT24458.1 shikimate dehydrogenase [Anaerohalosphaeraceae bacterium]
MTILAVSISADTPERACLQIEQAVRQGAEAVELRLDFLRSPDAPSAAGLVRFAKSKGVGVAATCRHPSEGGAAALPEDKRLAVLAASLESGADFADWEFAQYLPVREALSAALRRNPASRLILSVHNFKGPFEDLTARYEAVRSVCPTAVVKLAYAARHIHDCFEGLDLLEREKSGAIVLGMGPAGAITRVLAKKLGGFLTFACLDEESAAAPGQIPLEKMKTLYRWDAIDGQTEVYGIVGFPLGHSLSPMVYNGCFEAEGRNAIFFPFEVEGGPSELNEFFQSVLERPWLHCRGFSVTLPHKTSMLEFVRREGGFADGPAERIGAANTLKIGYNGMLSAYNTDCVGAMDALTQTLGLDRHQLRNLEVAVLGAGGAARAVVAGLREAGCRVTVYNRTVQKAVALAEEFGCRAAPLEEVRNSSAAVFINCTSIGMTPHTDASPVPAEVFGPDKAAFDTVYNPLRTRFLREAEAAGARIVYGAEMFIRQAVAQYRHLVGAEPDEERIRQIVFRHLQPEGCS